MPFPPLHCRGAKFARIQALKRSLMPCSRKIHLQAIQKTSRKERRCRSPNLRNKKLSSLPRVESAEAGEAPRMMEVNAEEARAPALTNIEGSETAGVEESEPDLGETLRPSVDREPEPPGLTRSIAGEPTPAFRTKSFVREQPPQLIKVDPYVLRQRPRRDFLLFGAGAIAALAGAGFLLPQATLERTGSAMRIRPGRRRSGSSTKPCALTTMLQRRSIPKIASYSLTRNRRLPRSRTITTA